jgi:alpha-tubulin suppressor-like RCC1 family protein
VNNAGQLGDSTITSSAMPVAVHGGFTFTEVSAGGSTSCGLTAAGDAYCWGSDLYGVIGSGVALATCELPLNFFDPCALIPRAVAGSHKFAHVSTDDDHACGLTAAGAVWCWGYSENGDGTPTVPALVAGSITFTSITIGGRNCGMATDGMAYCWSGYSAPLRVPGQQ